MADELNIYDEIEIEDMTFDQTLQIYHYPCPCGDRFEIGIADLRDSEEIAICPSCSLMIKVIFDLVPSPPRPRAPIFTSLPSPSLSPILLPHLSSTVEKGPPAD
jgi:diphthamide biosynthesis protein 3